MIVLIALVFTLLTLTAQAPALPPFAGTWVPVEGASADRTLVVAQTAARLTITRRGDDPPIEVNLDGTATKQTDELVKVTAKRAGDALVLTIVTTTNFGDTSIRNETWTLDATGRLVVERDRQRPARGIERVVYRRSP